MTQILIPKSSAWVETPLPFSDAIKVGPRKPNKTNIAVACKAFLRHVEDQVLGPLGDDDLAVLSASFQKEIRQRLVGDPTCMLPSFNHALPTGAESGAYLAIDVGGSTLRVALVQLKGHGASEIQHIRSYKIGSDVKALVGVGFFDWMVTKIIQSLEEMGQVVPQSGDPPLFLSLAWSFPIEQTSLASGNVRPMGKSFRASEGLAGQDLGHVLEQACARRGMCARLAALVNDAGATLLSGAYAHPSCRLALVLGTGLNLAAHLPLQTVGGEKLGDRTEDWHAQASDSGGVIINCEAGMFGRDTPLPTTTWDEALKRDLGLEMSPLEYMTSGLYLGEVARRVVVEAIQRCGLLGGVVPAGFDTPYGVSTALMSQIEGDVTPSLRTAKRAFRIEHPSPTAPTTADMLVVRAIFHALSRRSAALVAAYIHAMLQTREETVADPGAGLTTKVAFTGSVIEGYVGYREACQAQINRLVGRNERHGYSVELVPAKESSLLGAGVALASTVE